MYIEHELYIWFQVIAEYYMVISHEDTLNDYKHLIHRKNSKNNQ